MISQSSPSSNTWKRSSRAAAAASRCGSRARALDGAERGGGHASAQQPARAQLPAQTARAGRGARSTRPGIATWIAEGFRGLEEQAKRFTADGKYMFGSSLTMADVLHRSADVQRPALSLRPHAVSRRCAGSARISNRCRRSSRRRRKCSRISNSRSTEVEARSKRATVST